MSRLLAVALRTELVQSGGYGFFSRETGLVVDQVVSIDGVLANGTSFTANADTNQEVRQDVSSGLILTFRISSSGPFVALLALLRMCSFSLLCTFSYELQDYYGYHPENDRRTKRSNLLCVHLEHGN